MNKDIALSNNSKNNEISIISKDIQLLDEDEKK